MGKLPISIKSELKLKLNSDLIEISYDISGNVLLFLKIKKKIYFVKCKKIIH